MTCELRSARFLAAEWQEKIICPGDCVVDATLGNGYDTLRLANLVGAEGHVIGFDIQHAAVERATARLREAGVIDRCELYAVGHERMLEYVHHAVRCVVFNLGWLPGGDKSITTHWETTEIAVRSAMKLLCPGGILSICVYPGHAAGAEERQLLIKYLELLKPQEYNVLRQHFINAGADAPECFIVQKQ